MRLRRLARAAVLVVVTTALGGLASDAQAAGLVRTDFNGDGLADVVVPGAPQAIGGHGDLVRHSALVVLGRRDPQDVDVASPAPGSTIGVRSRDDVDASWIGDVDGDGLADLRVRTTRPVEGGRPRAYVVFGRRELADINVEGGGSGVLRIPNVTALGWPVGDLNGDGVDELAFGGDNVTGAVIVISGRHDRAPIRRSDLQNPGPRGFRLDLGPWREGVDTVASAGDANGDGFGDLVVVPLNYSLCVSESGCGGQPFVIFGRRRMVDLELTGSYGSGRFAVRTRRAHRPAGYYVDAIAGYRNVDSGGDFDGDGRDDLFVTSWLSGEGALLLYGRASTRPVRANPPRDDGAIRILPTQTWGQGAGPIGDVNGDGRADLLVMVERITRAGESRRSLAVVLGRGSRATIDLRRDGPRISVPPGVLLDWYGPLGDVNGDGLPDFALQGSRFDNPVWTYVIFGTRAQLPRSLQTLGPGGFVIS